MNPDQTVSQMVEQVLSSQARELADRSGMTLGDAKATVAVTEAGAQLRELGEGEYRHEKARSWQANLALERARQRAIDLGRRWRPERSDLSPSEPALLREPLPERTSVHEGGSVVVSEEALVGMRVKVHDDHRSADLRGREGTIEARWGDKDHAALDVLLDNGFSQLFWYHELRHAGEGNGSVNGNRNDNGNGRDS